MLLNLILPCLLAVPVPPSSGIEPAASQEQESGPGWPVVVQYFAPTKAPVEELSEALRFLYSTRRRGAGEAMPLFQPLGETLLIQTSQETLEEVLRIAGDCDANYVGRGENSATSQEQWQYEVKHVALDSVRKALRYLDRSTFIEEGTAGGLAPRAARGLRISYVDERGLLIAQGTAAEIERARLILRDLDVPRSRLMLTCYVVQGSNEESTEALPAELLRDLGKLVPFAGFELLSTGVLPTDASREVSMSVDLDDQRGSFELEMLPSAYDARSGQLALSSITFKMVLNPGAPAASRSSTRRSFQTSTSLRTDRYTVLGAVGATPVFVVVKLTDLGV